MKKVKILKTSFIYGTRTPLVEAGDVYVPHKLNTRFAYVRHKIFNCEVRLTVNRDCVVV